MTDPAEARREAEHRERLEKAGFRIAASGSSDVDPVRRAARYPAGHCWHLVPHADDPADGGDASR